MKKKSNCDHDGINNGIITGRLGGGFKFIRFLTAVLQKAQQQQQQLQTRTNHCAGSTVSHLTAQQVSWIRMH